MKAPVVACFLMLLLGTVLSGTASAADVAITSVGQTADAMMAKILLKRLHMESEYQSLMTADMLGDQKVLIAVVGGSSKGLGIAGVSQEQEMGRAVSLLESAKEKGVKVLVMHLGGDTRRGDLTDGFIEAVTKLGDRIIVVKSGNMDGIFTKNKSDDAELLEADTVQGTAAALQATLAAWGVRP